MASSATQLFSRIASSWNCWKLTGYVAGRLIPATAKYSFNGIRKRLRGQYLLALIANIIQEDEYRLRQCHGIMSVADIGANVGVFALHAATLFPEAKIHCYEPDPRNLPDLEFNLEGIPVQVFPEAVSGANGFASLVLEDDKTASEICEIHPPGRNTAEVRTVDLAEVVRRFDGDRISFLKLDCEGSEYSIISQEAVRRFDRIAGELHITEQYSPMDAVDVLRRQGFALEEFRSFPGGKAVFVAKNEIA